MFKSLSMSRKEDNKEEKTPNELKKRIINLTSAYFGSIIVIINTILPLALMLDRVTASSS